MDLGRSILVLAPHLQYPLENGADILIGSRINGFTSKFKNVTVIGANFVSSYINSNCVYNVSYKNTFSSKFTAAVIACFSTKSYLYNKFITSAFLRRIQDKDILNRKYDVVYYSFIHTAEACYPFFSNAKLHFLETHNDDLVWNSNLYENTNNLIVKYIAYRSIIFTKRFLNDNKDDFIYIVLNNQDKLGYTNYIPDDKMVCIPAGINIPANFSSIPEDKDVLNLIFVGSLNVNMNYDALYYFSKNYYDEIIDSVKKRIIVNVVGRSPTDKVRALCNKYKWSLFPNVSDATLSRLLYSADFMLLPFPYTTGTKMKLLEAFAHNLPILATDNIRHQIDLSEYENYNYGVFSTNSKDWINYINSNKQKRDLTKIAKKFSVDNVNKLLLDYIDALL